MWLFSPHCAKMQFEKEALHSSNCVYTNLGKRHNKEERATCQACRIERLRICKLHMFLELEVHFKAKVMKSNQTCRQHGASSDVRFYPQKGEVWAAIKCCLTVQEHCRFVMTKIKHLKNLKKSEAAQNIDRAAQIVAIVYHLFTI